MLQWACKLIGRLEFWYINVWILIISPSHLELANFGLIAIPYAIVIDRTKFMKLVKKNETLKKKKNNSNKKIIDLLQFDYMYKICIFLFLLILSTFYLYGPIFCFDYFYLFTGPDLIYFFFFFYIQSFLIFNVIMLNLAGKT